MQIIQTKILTATNTKPTRIVATNPCFNSMRVTVSRDAYNELNDAHKAAAKILMQRLRWSGTMIGGHTKGGMVFVFDNLQTQKHLSISNTVEA